MLVYGNKMVVLNMVMVHFVIRRTNRVRAQLKVELFKELLVLQLLVIKQSHAPIMFHCIAT